MGELGEGTFGKVVKCEDLYKVKQIQTLIINPIANKSYKHVFRGELSRSR